MLEKHTTDFLAYCKVTDFSNKSRESLKLSLQEFVDFANSLQTVAVQDIAHAHLVGFVADFKAPSVYKQKARVWCLHQFFHFLTVTGHIEENIALGIPYPKIEKIVPHFLTIEEFNRIIDYFSHKVRTKNGLRDLVIILMLGLLGLRSGTLVALNLEHIDIGAGLAWLQEKGGRQRHLVLPSLLVTILDYYISVEKRTHGPLFLSTRKKRISPRTLQEIFRSAADNLGIEKRLHAHLFRHTAATHLNKVAGTTITKAVLGHERRHNTLKYAHLNPDKYAEYMRRHPYVQEANS